MALIVGAAVGISVIVIILVFRPKRYTFARDRLVIRKQERPLYQESCQFRHYVDVHAIQLFDLAYSDDGSTCTVRDPRVIQGWERLSGAWLSVLVQNNDIPAWWNLFKFVTAVLFGTREDLKVGTGLSLCGGQLDAC